MAPVNSGVRQQRGLMARAKLPFQVVPITSNIDKLYPSESYITLNGDARKAVADQLTTVSKSRLKNQIGSLAADDMKKIAQAIKTQLDLN